MPDALTYPRVVPAGDCAFLAEFGDAIDPIIMGRVQAAMRAVNAAAPDGMIEAQPTFKSLLVRFDPVVADADALFVLVRAVAEDAAGGAAVGSDTRVWDVPVVYGGAAGPELGEVADLMGISEAEAAAAHGADEVSVVMLGFGAGVAYIAQHGPAWDIPRRATVQAPVAPGAVIVAIRQTVFTPVSMPTGWRWIGTSPLLTFDKARNRPILLSPGDRIRFHAITNEEAEAFDPEPLWAAL